MSELSIDDILNGDDVEVAEVAQETEQVTDTAEQAANEDTKGEAEEQGSKPNQKPKRKRQPQKMMLSKNGLNRWLLMSVGSDKPSKSSLKS